MPQNRMSYEGRRRGTPHNTCRANGQATGTGLANGAVVHNDWPVAANRSSEHTPADTLNGPKPQCMVNGYINHGYKSRSRKAPPPRTYGKHGSAIPAVPADALAAGAVVGAANPGGISANGATSLDTAALPCNSDQMAPASSLSGAAKSRRRRSKFRSKKRPPPTPPQQEEEDWENEIEDWESEIADWEKMRFVVTPYGPEDVLHFALRDLTLERRHTVDLPVTANYSPTVHHPHPIKWLRRRVSAEPGQFADADE